MFERNFIKITVDDTISQDALVAKANIQKGNKKSFKTNVVCHYCKKKGHVIKFCRNWIANGRPPKKSEENQNQDAKVVTNVALVTICSEAYSMQVDEDNWWIDNGATKHLTNSSKYFIDFEAFKVPHVIKAAGKEILTAVGSGSIRILSTVQNKSYELILKDV